MKNEPLISVMMPVYNGLPLIKASIESLLLQTYENWECIVIDDGSIDGTSEYLDTLDDARFRVYHQINMGRPIARQRALDLANGTYLAMLDAGDLFHPEKLRKQVLLLESNSDISLVTTAICSFGTSNEHIYIRGTEITRNEIFTGNNHPTHAPSLLRMDRAKLCKYNPTLKLGEDQDYLEKYLKPGDTFIHLSDIYYYYSELDSVSKSKIRKNYYLYAIKYFKERNIKLSLSFTLKYIYSVLVFPFISIDKILSRRGRKPTEDQFKQYKFYCKQIIDQIL